MRNRCEHQQEVKTFLSERFSTRSWEITIPHGWGNENYYAHGNDRVYFVKLNTSVANYQAMASIGLTPPVLATGVLEDGTSLLVQPYVTGRTPTRHDFRNDLDHFARMVARMHHSPEVSRVLPPAPSNQYRMLARQALMHLRLRWEQYKGLVPSMAALVDESLAFLEGRIDQLDGAGVVASHNDICNANWIITPDGQIYLVDLDAMSMDDPACDLGALLWWYYPPELRPRFLDIAGYPGGEQFKQRMQVRMAIHCLSITIPRENSFDQFNPATYGESLTDFLAAVAGEENPQGYNN